MSEDPTTGPDWYALGVRIVEAVERLGAALEQIPTGPPLDRCPACDSMDLDEIEEAEGLLALQCAGCGHSWFPEDDDETARTAGTDADATRH